MIIVPWNFAWSRTRHPRQPWPTRLVKVDFILLIQKNVAFISTQGETTILRHQHLGHSLSSIMLELSNVVVHFTFPKLSHLCENCALGKSTRLPSHILSKRAPFPLHTIHSGMGPASVTFVSLNWFYVIFIVSFSQYTWFYPLWSNLMFFFVSFNFNIRLKIILNEK